ncbi:MAG: hypothetical protein M8835_13325 [marine benthic group bacterium]|nr:hypothetical protein [Gemmatimonadota bacterium]
MNSNPAPRTGSWLAGLASSLLLVVAITSCAVEEASDFETGSRAGTVESESGSSPDRIVPNAEEPDTSPFRNFPLPPDPAVGSEVERHPVRITNPGSAIFIVRASAGAAPVVLDTLEPGESYRVDLDAPPGTLRIEWRSLDGRVYGDAPVESGVNLLADSVSIVRIEANSGSD